MLTGHKDPIIAIATAPGRGAVGIVRLSGQAIGSAIVALLGRTLKAREATYLPFLREDGSVIDRGLAIHFPAPNSFTGEDVLELQAHGGPVVLQLLVARLLELGIRGARLAEPGEFSQRAFLNGKMDLMRAPRLQRAAQAAPFQENFPRRFTQFAIR
jgi:tRNA modification GTPase